MGQLPTGEPWLYLPGWGVCVQRGQGYKTGQRAAGSRVGGKAESRRKQGGMVLTALWAGNDGGETSEMKEIWASDSQGEDEEVRKQVRGRVLALLPVCNVSIPSIPYSPPEHR